MEPRIIELLCQYSDMSPHTSPPPAERSGWWGWVDSSAGLLQDGEPVLGSQVLERRGDPHRALVLPDLDQVLILACPSASDRQGGSVARLPRRAFHLAPDRDSALSEAAAARGSSGWWLAVNGSRALVEVDGRKWLLGPRQGPAGEISADRLWELMPVWRARAKHHRPAPEVVAALRRCPVPTAITCAWATWCHLSKEFIPCLLKALEAADNPLLKTRLVAIDDRFTQPRQEIRNLRLINVPTVVVEQAGREIGRIVETPAAARVEEDLVAILTGQPRDHRGRWSRGPLVARGEYRLGTPDGGAGRESWEVYALPRGSGALLHSLRVTALHRLETWLRLDGRGRPQLVEITEDHGQAALRARHLVDGASWIAWQRGTWSGSLQQRIGAPERLALLAPAVAASGWGWLQARAGREIQTYLCPGQPPAGLGSLVPTRFELDPTPETVRVEAGEFSAHRLAIHLDTGSGGLEEAWLWPDLYLAVRGRTHQGLSYEMVSMEVAAPAPSVLWQAVA